MRKASSPPDAWDPRPPPRTCADDSTLEIALQALGAVVLGGAGAAGLVGGSVLGSAQKL